jgi:hypothetical protein
MYRASNRRRPFSRDRFCASASAQQKHACQSAKYCCVLSSPAADAASWRKRRIEGVACGRAIFSLLATHPLTPLHRHTTLHTLHTRRTYTTTLHTTRYTTPRHATRHTTLHYTLQTPHPTPHTTHYTLHTTHYTLHTTHYIRCTAHPTHHRLLGVRSFRPGRPLVRGDRRLRAPQRAVLRQVHRDWKVWNTAVHCLQRSHATLFRNQICKDDDIRAGAAVPVTSPASPPATTK